MKRIIAALGLLTLLLAVSACATGQSASTPFDEGWDAYKRGDYATALREFRTLAQRDDAEAQYNLGSLYYHVQGVPQDYAEAAKWIRKSAEKHFVAAEISLGLMYENGQGLPQDYREAVKLYRGVATLVTSKAQLSLKAIHFERTSSLTGAHQSYLDQIRDKLGIRSWRAYLVEAYKWCDIMALLLPSGQVRNMIDKTRDDMTEEMTSAQVAEARRLAREWMAKFEARKK